MSKKDHEEPGADKKRGYEGPDDAREPAEQSAGSAGQGGADASDELTVDEWRHNWLVDHTPVAIDTQGTFGYVQNPVLEALTPGGQDVAGIVEELFPMAGMSDPHAFYGSGGDDAELQRRLTELMDSCARFGAADGLDLVPTSRYLFGL